MKKISPEVLVKLENALTNIYWYKKDLHSFIATTIRDPRILATQEWTVTPKRELVKDLIQRFARNELLYQKDLLALICATINFSDFSHLERLEDGKEKMQTAKESVKALRNMSKVFFDQFGDVEKKEALAKRNVQKIQQQKIQSENLAKLKTQYFDIVKEPIAQKKGFLFEHFLYELFKYFDLDPKKSFRIEGEQIDGAFSFDGNDYLLEAKWKNIADISKGTLMEFGAKVLEKLDNTLGVFVSYNGFSEECMELNTTNALKPIFLISGMEISMVLEGRITLPDMLLRKRRHAAQHGKIFLDITK